MKKLSILFLSFVCLSSLSVFADSPCDNEVTKKTYQTQNTMPKNQGKYKYYYYKTQQQPCQPKCNKQKSTCNYFLCTNADMNTLFENMCLSDTQICNAEKINDKYNQEVLSITERIECENQKYCEMKENCAKNNELRKQKKLIKKLEKKKKEICKCYEKEFKTTLSKDQQKAYNKYKKCK